jgi:hypothetical protein
MQEMTLAVNVISLFFIVAFLLIAVFFFLTQQNVLKAVRHENRTMATGRVWLQFIPIFGLYWQFIVNKKIAESLSNELSSRQKDDLNALSENEGITPPKIKKLYYIGLAYCILISAANIPFRPLQLVLIVPAFICWIVYWIQLTILKNSIKFMKI